MNYFVSLQKIAITPDMSVRNFLLFTLAFCPLILMGQEVGKESRQAEHIFTLLLEDQTDSLFAAMSEDIRKQLSRQQMDGTMKQLEQMLGPYQRHGEWEHQQGDKHDTFLSIVDFEHGQLSFSVTLDQAGLIQGIWLRPIQPQHAANNMPLPDDAVELDDTVHTSPDIALPCSIVLSGRSASPPLVVFVHGSGPLDRNETVMSNSTFLDLSRQLAEHGISSLRYDKRTLVYQKPVTSMDDETILDALAAIRLARAYSSHVILLGHSLGAMLAPEIASRSNLDGIIMMAAPARDLSDVVKEQIAYLSMPEVTPEQMQATMDQLRQQSPHYLEPQNQTEVAQRLATPMLILQGGRDYQVTMQDFHLWQQVLSGKPQVSFASYPDLNHLFLTGEGKSTPQEYATQGTIPQAVIDDIIHFINHQTDN